MGFTMTQIARRRANQLGDLVRMLELSAVNLDAGAHIPKQRLRHGLDDAGLARPRRSQEEEIPNWAAGRIQSRQKHLINFADFLDSGILAYDPAPKSGLKLLCGVAALRGIQSCVQSGFHFICHLRPSDKFLITPTNLGPGTHLWCASKSPNASRTRPSRKHGICIHLSLAALSKTLTPV